VGKYSEETEDKKRATALMSSVTEKALLTGKKGAEFAKDVVVQTAKGSKALATGLAKSAKDISEKAKNEGYIRRLKKYNPLFLAEYNREDFFVPNIICIVDDAVRRDVDVCKGAIGWRENKKGTEVLFLYDEFVKDCGLTFVPSALCDELYYVDSHNRSRYIKLDYIFQQSHEEKLAELEHIAYALGAKSCTIEFEEVEVTHDKRKRVSNVGGEVSLAHATENYSAEASRDSLVKYSSKSETKFKGNDKVVLPTLKWFEHDKNIQNLIEYRCRGGNEITTKTLRLSGSSSATMSRKAANSIDAAVSELGINQSYSMEDKSVKESDLKIVYHLDF